MVDTELRKKINTQIIEKITELVEIDKDDLNVSDNMKKVRAISQRLIEICTLDINGKLTADLEREMETLMYEFAQKTGSIEEEYDKFKHFSETEMQTISTRLEEIKNLKLIDSDKEAGVKFNSSINTYIDLSFNKKYNKNIEEYMTRLGDLKLVCITLKDKVDSLTDSIREDLNISRLIDDMISEIVVNRPSSEAETKTLIDTYLNVYNFK